MYRVVVAAIAEASVDGLTGGDKQFIESLRSDKRRREVRAWRSQLRMLLRELGFESDSKKEILYNDLGAPYIVDSPLFISVSHSSTHVAVMVSDSKCAIDIESMDRDFDRVASRYVSPREHGLVDALGEAALPLIWSAKETLYKYAGRDALDMIHDLQIISVDREKSSLIGSITPHTEHITMHYSVNSRHIVVHII